jgi:hypothetical protein
LTRFYAEPVGQTYDESGALHIDRWRGAEVASAAASSVEMAHAEADGGRD